MDGMITSDAVQEWRAYEEAGILVLGIRLNELAAPISTLVFQIDREGTDQRQDAWGMSAEIDGATTYSVRNFDFDEAKHCVRVEFDEGASNLNPLQILLPHAEDTQSALVAIMAETQRSYPPRRRPA